MKKAFLTILAIPLILNLSACQEVKKTNPKLDAWNRTEITSRYVGDTLIPSKYIFDCRKLSETQNIHHYYNLIADPKTTEVRNDIGEKETIYPQAEFSIEYFSINLEGTASLHKSFLTVNVDFKVIESSQGISVALVTANAGTVATFQKYYQNNPYFNRVQVGDEIMRIANHPYQRQNTNMTKLDLPGISNGESLECR